MPLKNRNSLLLTLMVFIIGLSPRVSLAQASPDTIYIPQKDDSLSLEDTLAVIQTRYKLEKDTLRGDNRKYILQFYDKRFDNIRHQFRDKALLTLPEAQAYLQALINEIMRSNPELGTRPVNVYFAKTGIPNAAFIGDGVIVFNLGLLVHMQNESQVVFVLCHELAHFYLNHSNNDIAKYVGVLYSKETQEQLRRIQRQEFHQAAMVEQLAKSVEFDDTRHSRAHESEADSMGLVFMHNTRYDVGEALTCLALLDTVDNEAFRTEAFLKQVFNTPEYPFQNRWLHQETGLLGGHAVIKEDKPLADSMKTHPDCSARILALEPAVRSWQGSGRKKDILDRKEFERLRGLARYEILRYDNDSKQYGRCLMNACELLDEHPGDPYVVSLMGEALHNIYLAQKGHVLSRSVPLPAPWYNANYNTLLQFIQNLYLDEIAQIDYYFLKQYENRLSGYPAFAAAYAAARTTAGK